MRTVTIILLLIFSLQAEAQLELGKVLAGCKVTGSVTVYDYNKKEWTFSDKSDAGIESLPASTFKVINLLIALQTGVIKDENEIVKWVGKTDTTLYGYRPEIYHDMSVKEAFRVSAGWVFIELAKKIGRENYLHYLSASGYGNLNLSEKDPDFWNFGAFGISPVNQVNFLIRVYEGKLPFSTRNLQILKKVMVTEKTGTYTLLSKTGWTRVGGKNIGWWVGYVESNNNVYFFATRISRPLDTRQTAFGECRKLITRAALRELKIIE